jgi:hypothetical protein
MKKLEEIKRKEFYRDAVKQRNNELVDEKKGKALWRLEKIEMKSPAGRQNGKIGNIFQEEDRGGASSRKSF